MGFAFGCTFTCTTFLWGVVTLVTVTFLVGVTGVSEWMWVLTGWSGLITAAGALEDEPPWGSTSMYMKSATAASTPTSATILMGEETVIRVVSAFQKLPLMREGRGLPRPSQTRFVRG